MSNKFLSLLKSRKFWAALIGLLFVFLGDNAGFDSEQITNAVYLIVSFIVAVGFEQKAAA